jgi:hypothetical protein
VNPNHASTVRREEYLAEAFRRLATAFLLNRRPRDSDLILFNMAVVEATLSGDRAQLNVALGALRRLARYLPEEADFSQEVRTVLWVLGLTCASALLLLEIEFDRALSD